MRETQRHLPRVNMGNRPVRQKIVKIKVAPRFFTSFDLRRFRRRAKWRSRNRRRPIRPRRPSPRRTRREKKFWIGCLLALPSPTTPNYKPCSPSFFPIPSLVSLRLPLPSATRFPFIPIFLYFFLLTFICVPDSSLRKLGFCSSSELQESIEGIILA